MTIAVLQCSPVPGEVKANLYVLEQLTASVSCQVLVVPELVSTGYFYTRPEQLTEHAEYAGKGPLYQWAAAAAARLDCVVVAGFAERSAGDRLYNAAITVLPSGEWSVYRKTHLFYKEKLVFTPGDTGFSIVRHNGVGIGTMICYDWRFPESARTLALKGADIIAHPSNLVASADLWIPTMATRAFENKVITATANRWGAEERDGERLQFSGRSTVIGMNGKVLCGLDSEGDAVAVAQADPLATRDKTFNPYNDILKDRRPDMYQ